MILTAKQIVALAMFAGLMVDKEMLDNETLETEFQVFEEDGKHFAFYNEYPEDGGVEI